MKEYSKLVRTIDWSWLFMIIVMEWFVAVYYL